jgi:predicted nucleic acid-binding protein
VILVDTGPLVALCDARDPLHATAIAHLPGLARPGFRVCESVLTEACFHLPHRAQRHRLRAVLQELHFESFPTGTDDFRDAVFDWLLRYAEHQPDWTDGCLAVLCGQQPRLKLWTYDREFRTTWRRPDGRAIPLAVR